MKSISIATNSANSEHEPDPIMPSHIPVVVQFIHLARTFSVTMVFYLLDVLFRLYFAFGVFFIKKKVEGFELIQFELK